MRPARIITGLLLLVMAAGLGASAPVRCLPIAWDYVTNQDNPASNVVFIIRQRTNATSGPWQVLGVATNSPVFVQYTNRQMFFSVLSSNRVTHALSSY